MKDTLTESQRAQRLLLCVEYGLTEDHLSVVYDTVQPTHADDGLAVAYGVWHRSAGRDFGRAVASLQQILDSGTSDAEKSYRLTTLGAPVPTSCNVEGALHAGVQLLQDRPQVFRLMCKEQQQRDAYRASRHS